VIQRHRFDGDLHDGLHLNLVVAITHIASNHMQRDPMSLHSMGPDSDSLNRDQKSIPAVGAILWHDDSTSSSQCSDSECSLPVKLHLLPPHI
jgi:hypothetical protein